MPDTQHAAPKQGITDEGYLTDSWYLAAPSTDLVAGKQHRIMVLGEPVVVGRTPKGEPFALAMAGTMSLETALGAMLGLVHDGQLDLIDALRAMTSGPADLLGLPQGRIAEGAPADLILVDGDKPWVCHPDDFHSARGNSAWAGRRFQGRVLQTLVGGVTIHNLKA